MQHGLAHRTPPESQPACPGQDKGMEHRTLSEGWSAHPGPKQPTQARVPPNPNSRPRNPTPEQADHNAAKTAATQQNQPSIGRPKHKHKRNTAWHPHHCTEHDQSKRWAKHKHHHDRTQHKQTHHGVAHRTRPGGRPARSGPKQPTNPQPPPKPNRLQRPNEPKAQTSRPQGG